MHAHKFAHVPLSAGIVRGARVLEAQTLPGYVIGPARPAHTLHCADAMLRWARGADKPLSGAGFRPRSEIAMGAVAGRPLLLHLGAVTPSQRAWAARLEAAKLAAVARLGPACDMALIPHANARHALHFVGLLVRTRAILGQAAVPCMGPRARSGIVLNAAPCAAPCGPAGAHPKQVP